MLLLKWHTAGGGSRQFFDLVFTFLASAPHGLYKAWFLLHRLLEGVKVCGLVGMGIPMRFCTLKHILLNRLKQPAHFRFQLIESHEDLLMGIAAD